MPDRSPPLSDVIIAGAGPVGLFLACELRLAGLTVLVLEREGDAASPLKRLPFGLRGLSVPTVEALDRRDLLGAVAAPRGGADIARSAHWMRQPRRAGGHFAGIPFFNDAVDASAWPHRRPGPAEAGLPVELAHLEAVLAAQARAAGVEVRRGLAVEAVDRTGEGVAVRAGGEAFRGRWLVGCDGGRSAVRKLCGFAVVGTEPEFTGTTADVDLVDPDRLSPGRQRTAAGMYTFTPPGLVAMVEFDGGARHRAGPITLDHVQSTLRRVSGTDVAVTALRLATTWTDRARQATAYRRGRVLLAGDAAHVHSPLGGQGLNLGLGDAMNLGWKLAAVARGDGPDGLLDSYEAERHPVGAQVLGWSRAQVALMRPDPGSRALEAVLRDLVATRDGATHMAGRVWGTALRHDLGGGHPLVGFSAPDVALADGARLGERLRAGRGLLLDFGDGDALRDLAGRWGGRFVHAAARADDRLGVSAMLVRPDGLVAWAGEGPPDLDEAARIAARWFGEPAASPA